MKKIGGVDKILVVFMITGGLIAVVSLFRGIWQARQVQVEVIEVDQNSSTIFVDIGGAVISPGVYELPLRSRLKDALVAAGGYTADADREFSEKVFNLAEVVTDGQKIYIPKISDTPGSGGYPEAKSGAKLVNVNTAGLTELDTLDGIGMVRAESIVKNRPYKSLDELVSKKVITQSILDKNIDKLSVY